MFDQLDSSAQIEVNARRKEAARRCVPPKDEISDLVCFHGVCPSTMQYCREQFRLQHHCIATTAPPSKPQNLFIVVRITMYY